MARTDGSYSVVDSDAMGRLLTAAAEVNVAAQRVLAERARTGVARPVRDSVSQLVSATAPTSHIRIRCERDDGKAELQFDSEHTKRSGVCP